MIRRRRRRRDVPFSFDSFLDVVANVCGIIIRLILVVWVGARSYTALKHLAVSPEPPPEAVASAGEDDTPDPPDGELAEERRALADVEAALLTQLRDLAEARGRVEQTGRERDAVAARRRAADDTLAGLRRAAGGERTGAAALPPVEELKERLRRLSEEAKALEALPPARRALRYRTPVSRPLDAEELMFECRRGRVTFVDVAALIEEVKRGLGDKAETLKRTWEVSDVAGPAGPFRLRYAVERLRDGLGAGAPDPGGGFRYGLSSWVVEPVTEARGETAAEALKPTSEFRQIVDHLDPRHAAVTFWVYPDSFAAFRRLRDYLYERDLVVAGRPLPEGAPIASSRHGTASRGQ